MSTVTFDTLKFVQRLEKAGIAREHATAEAEALAEVFEANGKELATKADLRDLKSELKLEMQDIRAEMRSMELRLTIKLGAFMAASVGTTVALIKLL